ncbi:hypothetical protein KM043_001565 [Ampulex compressa]|nr:hypothetical protein KM043_001565 [Ampulex compressa]
MPTLCHLSYTTVLHPPIRADVTFGLSGTVYSAYFHPRGDFGEAIPMTRARTGASIPLHLLLSLALVNDQTRYRPPSEKICIGRKCFAGTKGDGSSKDRQERGRL